jgi:ribosomal protein S18 acetylase RimI-like enzyme
MVARPALEATGLTETGQEPGLGDARILQKAIRDSVSTSPEAFLKTVDDVDELELDYWEKEIYSSTWAVIERGQEVVGIAVARWPHREMDQDIDPKTSRFIESVWIHPELRGRQMGERLMRFLFDVECEKNADIRQFLLWVFDKNHRAIRLYERMGFVYTEQRHEDTRGGRTEIQYQLAFDTVVMKTTGKAVDEAARQDDLRQFGVSYRILGGNTE